MRGANRNKQVFWYASYTETGEDTDEYGNIDTQYAKYGKPVRAEGNISPPKGDAATMQFGIFALYDRVIGPLPMNTAVNEAAVLWIDTVPALDANGDLAVDNDGQVVTPHNYVVKRKSPSLPVFGGVMLGVDRVTVT